MAGNQHSKDSPEQVKERFLSYCKKMESGCWEWQGGYYGNGYGCFSEHHKPDTAHRFSVKILKGLEIQKGLHICHTCNNKKCVNPDHLYIGTPKDNAEQAGKDGLLKGINAGTNHGMSKLNDEDVLKIRDTYNKGEITQNELARIFGVCRRTIGDVVNRKHWKHI